MKMIWSAFAMIVVTFIVVLFESSCRQANHRANLAMGQCLAAGGTPETFGFDSVICSSVGQAKGRSVTIPDNGFVEVEK